MLFDVSSIRPGAAEAGGDFRLLWVNQISAVQQIGGVPVYAYGNTAHTNDSGRSFFMTGATFLADKTTASGAPPFMHPDATTLFAYDASGKLLWKWQTEGGLSKLKFSRQSGYAVIPVYHNYVTRQKDKSGIYVLDLSSTGDNPLVWVYYLEGVAVAAGIAGDGTTIVGVEVPIRMTDDRPSGKHRLHVLQ